MNMLIVLEYVPNLKVDFIYQWNICSVDSW